MCLRIWQLQCLCACSHTELHLTRTLALQGAFEVLLELAACKALAIVFPATQPLRPIQPDGWARGSGRGTGDPAT